jgi:predicted permease
LRQALVVSQIAVSLVLVFGAVLFAGTLRNLLLVDTGFKPDGVLVARVDYDALEIPQESRAAFKRDVLDRIASVPGIGSAAEVRHVPMGGTGTSVGVGFERAGSAVREGMPFNLVTEGFLETMGIPRIAGRDFERRDHGTRVAIVNRTFAGRLGLENPVGATFRAEADWIEGRPDVVFEIVGYVPDTKYSDQREEAQPIVFIPFGVIADPRPFTDFMIRSTMPASAAAAAVKGAIREVSPRIRTDIRPFNETIRDRLLPQRLLATLAGFFGVLAVLVAAVGLYGVMSYLVVRRTNEIGVRMALGASRKNIMALVLTHAARLLTIGCVAGSLLAFGAGGLVQSLVFGLEARSIAPVALACLLFAFVAALACYLPAARAAAVEPREALRRE